MNQRDLWFVGLFALACFYLETRASAPEAPSAAPDRLLPPPPKPLALLPASVGIVPRNACPRNLAHRVSVRHDGAMWCLGCDEAYYPQGSILGTLMGAAA